MAAKRRAVKRSKGTTRGKKLAGGKKINKVKPLSTIYMKYGSVSGGGSNQGIETTLPTIPSSAITG